MEQLREEAVETMQIVLDAFSLQGDFVSKFPMILHEGIPEGWIHQTVISYLVVLGHELGYASLTDVGLLDPGLKRVTREKYDRRPDSVWMDRNTQRIIALSEVESSDLIAKAKNIMRYSEHVARTQERVPPVLSTILWWGNWEKGDWKSARDILKSGFNEKGTQFYPPKEYLLVARLKFMKLNDGRRFGGIELVDILKDGKRDYSILKEITASHK